MNGSAHEGSRSLPTETLLNRHVLLYWRGAACIALGDAVVFIALPFLILDITSDRAALAAARALLGRP